MKAGATIKDSFQNCLGTALKSARKSHGVTQGILAQQTGLSRPTIQLLERGNGNLKSWNKTLAALDMILRGRNLPAGETLGQQIALLRKRRGLGQRTLAKMVGVTQPTIVSLERKGVGRLRTLDRVLTVLGAGPVLAHKDTSAAFYVHAGNSSLHHGWETPAWLIDMLLGVFGEFDLDPCSPSHDKQVAPVYARMYYTMKDDGLLLPWHGTVFVNPPYGRTLRQWTAKAKGEVLNNNAQTVVGLVPARTDTSWWHDDIANCATVFFLRGRLSFGDCGQAAPFPSALVVWGGREEHFISLRAALPNAWQPEGISVTKV